jgi:hypothetical protein
MPVSERLKSEHIPVPTIDSQLRLSSTSQSRSFGSVSSSGGRVDHLAKPRLIRSPTMEPQQTPPVRPPVEHRSISYDNVPGTTTPGSSRRRRITSGLLVQSATPEEQPWSLFGQVMESGGQLRNLDSPRLRRSNDHLDASQSSMSGFTEILSDPFLATIAEPPPPPTPPLARGSRITNGSASESHTTLKQLPAADVPDYDSDISETSPEPVLDTKGGEQKQKWWSALMPRIPHVPVLYRNILKCALAYFVASLFTFSPYLSGLIADIASYGAGERRPSPSGHMVATM